MEIEQELPVADAKQAFHRWNKIQFEKLSDTLGNDAYKFISLIPLFYQLNNKLLPGYVGADTPVGVYSYKPDNSSLSEARKLNNKFRYQQEGVIKNFSIDSMFFQQELMQSCLRCWVFYRSSLNKNQILLLQDKTKKIKQWFLSKGLEIDFIFLSDNDFRNNKVELLESLNKAIFLDYFYSEIVFIAGKYPVWWLVPPAKEKDYVAFVEHIKQARFVDNEEFIDLGSVADLNRADIVSYAVDLVQKIKQSPEICLIKLLLADQKNSFWPEYDGISIRLKNMLYESQEVLSAESVIAKIMHDALSQYADNSYNLTSNKLFSRLKNIPGNLNTKIIDAYLSDSYVQLVSTSGIESVIDYLNFFKAVSFKVRQIFTNIVTRYNSEQNADDLDKRLTLITQNMLVFLSDNEGRIPLYNNKDKADIILNRILLKHEIQSNTKSQWNLVLEVSEANEKTIEGFNSLPGLLAWCWLNRVVNHSTQVSIDCPKQQLKQTEAHYVLEILIQQLNPALLLNIPSAAFESPVRPLQSLLFVNSVAINNDGNKAVATDNILNFNESPKKRIPHCDQLIINSWGDVYTKQYFGDSGILKCLCDWTHHAPLKSLAMPQHIMMFGYGVGDSMYMAQRIEQVYEEMRAFFYYEKNENGRFVIRMDSEYHVVIVDAGLLKPQKMGKRKDLIDYLEMPLLTYQSTALERLAFTEYPLREIYQLNKKNILQVFFQISNASFRSWVIDGEGVLCCDVIRVYDRESYIIHWLYFYKNIRNRFIQIKSDNKDFPLLKINQISFNLLGEIEFNAISADSVSGVKQFIDIQIIIEEHETVDQLSLICDGRIFEFEKHKENVLNQCIEYLLARITGEGRRAVYVTDIDVPLRLLNEAAPDETEFSHILKFKRNFERRINKLIGN